MGLLVKMVEYGLNFEWFCFSLDMYRYRKCFRDQQHHYLYKLHLGKQEQ
jgi:hypothetical protein